MTIEELRGANDFLSDAQIAIDNCEQEIDYEAVRTIRGFIDAEIARLSVTDVQIEIAATSLALMRDYVEKYMPGYYCLSKGAENIPLAIQALQAYRKPEVSDRESDIYCPWCGEPYEWIENQEIYEDGNCSVLTCGRCKKEFWVTTEVSYSFSTEQKEETNDD